MPITEAERQRIISRMPKGLMPLLGDISKWVMVIQPKNVHLYVAQKLEERLEERSRRELEEEAGGNKAVQVDSTVGAPFLEVAHKASRDAVAEETVRTDCPHPALHKTTSVTNLPDEVETQPEATPEPDPVPEPETDEKGPVQQAKVISRVDSAPAPQSKKRILPPHPTGSEVTREEALRESGVLSERASLEEEFLCTCGPGPYSKFTQTDQSILEQNELITHLDDKPISFWLMSDQPETKKAVAFQEEAASQEQGTQMPKDQGTQMPREQESQTPIEQGSQANLSVSSDYDNNVETQTPLEHEESDSESDGVIETGTQTPREQGSQTPKDGSATNLVSYDDDESDTEEGVIGSATQTPREQDTQTPTEQETQTPREQDTQTPTEQETQTPTEQETQTPTEQETQTAIEEETEIPTEEDTQAPTEQETQTPIERDTQTPIEQASQANMDEESDEGVFEEEAELGEERNDMGVQVGEEEEEEEGLIFELVSEVGVQVLDGEDVRDGISHIGVQVSREFTPVPQDADTTR